MIYIYPVNCHVFDAHMIKNMTALFYFIIYLVYTFYRHDKNNNIA